jgi:hypothetical protein
VWRGDRAEVLLGEGGWGRLGAVLEGRKKLSVPVSVQRATNSVCRHHARVGGSANIQSYVSVGVEAA